MKNIFILPTDKPSKKGDIVVWNGLKIWDGIGKPPHHNQNIYITSDEEIKGGDWVIDKHNVVYKQETDKIFTEFTGAKKIILTTDPDLIKDGVQAIDDEFLEWFVKNSSCKEVKIKTENYLLCKHCNSLHSTYSDGVNCDVCRKQSQPYLKTFSYKIIIPQEEITIIKGGDDIEFPSSTTITFKPLPDVNWESDITNKVWDEEETKQIKCYCGHTITCDCEPLQETLEEFINQSNTPEGLDQFSYDKGLKDGAKWQAERMYSEEEVLKLLKEFHFVDENYKTWFEQNKKKFG